MGPGVLGRHGQLARLYALVGDITERASVTIPHQTVEEPIALVPVWKQGRVTSNTVQVNYVK